MVKNILELFQSPELQYEEAPQYILVKIQALLKTKEKVYLKQPEKKRWIVYQFSSVQSLSCVQLFMTP